jgi:hypothetical protein
MDEVKDPEVPRDPLTRSELSGLFSRVSVKSVRTLGGRFLKRLLRAARPHIVARGIRKKLFLILVVFCGRTESPDQSRTPSTWTSLSSTDTETIHWVPLEKIRYFSGVAFSSQQHHFVRYLFEGISSLRKFYELHQPRNQFETNFLYEKHSGSFVEIVPPATRAPWNPKTYLHGGDRNHLSIGKGHQGYGPVEEVRVRWEAKRLTRIERSFRRFGFRKELSSSEPNPRFALLCRDDLAGDYRVMVTAGNHRIAALAFLGWPLIPMSRQPSYPTIRLGELESWPGVVDGTYSVEAAHDYFLSYFRDEKRILLPGWDY